MKRRGVAVLIVMAVAMLTSGDSQKNSTGERREGTQAGRPLWEQPSQHKRPFRSQGHSARGTEDHASSHTLQAKALVRLPRATQPQGQQQAADVSSSPRSVRQPPSQLSPQQRARVNRRQSTKQGTGTTRRLIG